MKYHKCSKCNNKATWSYAPSYSKSRMIMFCDEHVPRGCTCNVWNIEEFGEPSNEKEVIWWNKDEKYFTLENSHKIRTKDSFYYEITDNNMRNPCCEYDYSEEGFEKEYPIFMIKKKDILHIFQRVINKNNITDESFINEFSLYINSLEEEVIYNDFMNIIKNKTDFFNHRLYIMIKLGKNEGYYKFYNSFRSQLYELKYKKI